MQRLYRDNESFTDEATALELEVYQLLRPILKRVSNSGLSVRDAGLIICNLTGCLVSEIVLDRQISERNKSRTALCQDIADALNERKQCAFCGCELAADERKNGYCDSCGDKG